MTVALQQLNAADNEEFIELAELLVEMGELVRESWPFIAAMYVLLIICLFVPGIVTWLPHTLGY